MLRSSRCLVCSLILKPNTTSSPSLIALPRSCLPSSSLQQPSRHFASSPTLLKAKKAVKPTPPKPTPKVKKKFKPPPPKSKLLSSLPKQQSVEAQSWYTKETIEDIRASCADNLSQLNREIEHLSDFLRPTEEEDVLRREAFDEIAVYLQEAYGAESHAIGSLETRLYLPQGDTDMVVMVEPRPNLWTLARALSKKDLIYDALCLGRARVPIIKCYSSKTSLPLDISFNKSNGIDTARLINQYLDESPALRPLIMILKMFLQNRRMADPAVGGLGSYSLICMAISFFQNHPRIVSGELDPDVSPGNCLVDFLHLYGTLFHPDLLAIDIADSSLPERSDRDGDKSVFRVIDPQDASNNIAKPSYQFPAVQDTFALAHKNLATALLRPFNPNTSLLQPIVGDGADILAYRQRNAQPSSLAESSSSSSLSQSPLILPSNISLSESSPPSPKSKKGKKSTPPFSTIGPPVKVPISVVLQKELKISELADEPAS